MERLFNVHIRHIFGHYGPCCLPYMMGTYDGFEFQMCLVVEQYYSVISVDFVAVNKVDRSYGSLYYFIYIYIYIIMYSLRIFGND